MRVAPLVMGTIFLGQKCGTMGNRVHIYLTAHGMYLKMLPSDGRICTEATSRMKVNHVYLLNHAFFVFLWRTEYIQNKKSNTNYLYKPQTLNNLKADSKVVFCYLPMMGKSRNTIGII
jgi:hypothetical protein